jgi:hypothetical protein
MSLDDDTKPVVVKSGVFAFYESECSLQEAQLVNNRLRGKLLCVGEGEEWTDDFSYDRQMMEFSKEGVTFQSCAR